jgi:DNA-binding IscR family transcriptional regulator
VTKIHKKEIGIECTGIKEFCKCDMEQAWQDALEEVESILENVEADTDENGEVLLVYSDIVKRIEALKKAEAGK